MFDVIFDQHIGQQFNLIKLGQSLTNPLSQANVYAAAAAQEPVIKIQKLLQKNG